MERMRLRGGIGLPMALVTAAVFAACGSDNNNTNNGGNDAGIKQDATAGNPDATAGNPDATGGNPDATTTPDAGRADTGGSTGCTVGQEGCPCTSTLGQMDTAFKQDDCSAGLLCVPFDMVAGIDPTDRTEVDAPIQSCVKPCSVDGDCGTGRVCRTSGYTAESGAQKICVDQAAAIDEWCHYSKGTVGHKLYDDDSDPSTPKVPVTVQSAGVMRGCPEGVQCLMGFFSDVNPDEGICEVLCETSSECPTEAPYCNPKRFTGTSSTGAEVNIGVCSVAQLGLGSVCGTEDTSKTGIAYGCDTSFSADVGCLRVPNYFPDGLGFCGEGCGSANPCEGSEPGLGDYTCLIVDSTDPQQGGYCTIGCTDFPENCEGNGATGLGRYCNEDLSITGNTCNMASPNCPAGYECTQTQNGTKCVASYKFCMDRQGPALTPATLAGGQLTDPGDDCAAANNPIAFAKCPEGTFCLSDGTQGVCVRGCSRTATVSGCLTTTATTCAGGILTDETIGLCSN